jgi:hypothetical protein
MTADCLAKSSQSLDMPDNTRPLLIVCDWIPPAFGAVGQYEHARAIEAASQGRPVTLIGLGDNNEDKVQAVDAEGRSLRIIRLGATAPNKASLLQRGMWALSINLKLLQATASAAQAYANQHRACEIKVTGSPPFFSYLVLLWRGGRRRRFPIVYRITDFYPETAFAAGKGRALRPLAGLIHTLRRRADRIEALSDCQAQRLAESGVARAAIAVVRDTSPIAVSPQTRPSPRPYAAEDIVILYSGNLGVAHDWHTFAEGYRRHIQSGSNRARLWLNATGVGAPALRAYCEAHRLPIQVSSPAPLEQFPGLLAAADAHLVLLGDPFWGYVFPSKTYGCLDTGRPCLYVGPQESDVHALLGQDEKHHSVRQGDTDAVFRALETLARRPARRVVSSS